MEPAPVNPAPDSVDPADPAARCRLCGGETSPLRLPREKNSRQREFTYHRCLACGYIGLDSALFPDSASAKARYLQHRNDAGDSGYQAYLESFIHKAVAPFLGSNATVLDFGSGPYPALARLLEKIGYRCFAYDPFFSSDPLWKSRRYDLIAAHEVAEHLQDPARAFRELEKLLEPAGVIAIRTRFLPPSPEAFDNWWYRMDPTHVGFFSKAGLEKFFRGRGFEILASLEPDILVARARPPSRA